MPIYLPAPADRPGGPDGQGTNRIAIGSLAGDECALRPRDITTLVESWDTRRARYGGFGPCTSGSPGDCTNCSRLKALKDKPVTLPIPACDTRVQMRVDDRGRVWLLNHPEKGFASWGYSWTWEEMSRLTGWEYDGRFVDEHGDGFWLRRTA